MDFNSKIDSYTTYKNNGIRLETYASEWFDSPFECNPVDQGGRPVALIVTGHRTWEGDVNLTSQGYQDDRGEKLAKQWFQQNYGKRATLCVPVWVYQHGNAVLQRSPSCRWDSGFLGFICLHKGAIKGTNYDEIIDSYLREWTSYFNNEAHAYSLEVDSEHYDNDRCGGFTGDFESCGLVDDLIDQHEIALRVLFDDDTLTAEDIVKAFGRAFLRKLIYHGTSVGKKAKQYFEPTLVGGAK